MAGVRLGYAAAHPAWIAELDKVRPPYNVNALTQAVVPVLLRHAALLAEQAAAIRRERARMAAALAALRRVDRVSVAGQFRARPRAGRAALVRDVARRGHPGEECRRHGIRCSPNCLRITIGTPAENDALLEALSRYAMNSLVPTQRL